MQVANGGNGVATAEPPPRWTARGWLVAAAAAVTLTLVSVIRAWFPSIVHVYGDAGTTPAAQMGLFAATWFLLPLLIAPTMRRVGPVRWWRIGVGVLVAGRLALQLTDGGDAQLWTAGVALVGGCTALVALAAGAPSGHLARVGIVLGLGLESVRHAALGTLDLVWREGAAVVALVVVFGLVTVVIAERASRVPLWWPSPLDADGEEAGVWTRGSAWPWLAVGPAIVLHGILVSSPARLDLAAGIGPRAAVVAFALVTAVSLLAATLAPVLGAGFSGVAGAVLIVLTTLGAVRPVGVASAVAQLGLPVALGFVLGASTSPGQAGPRRRGATLAASLVLLLVTGFAYYASYEIVLPIRADWVLLGAAMVLAALALAAARDHRRLGPLRGVPQRALTVTTVAIVVLGAAVAPLAPAPAGPPVAAGDGGPLRVAAYNVHMGYDVDGRFDPDALAATIAATGADVLVLNEVDRGWLMEGGHDLLRLLAERTGMHATFAPAADAVWGNAILSRHPISDVAVVDLPRGGAAMRRSLVSAVVDLGAGRSLALVGTHLHHVTSEPAVRLAQARAVAAEVARLRARELPVAVLGDLNAAADAPELEPLAFLDDAVPGGRPTWPADDPTVRLDHVLVTPDLEVSDPAIVASTASDHLPVAVTLTVSR